MKVEQAMKAEQWYRSPIVWLAAGLLVASLVACIVTIAIALGQPADAVPGVGETVFRVPVARTEPALW